MEENKSLFFKEINEIFKDNYTKTLFTFSLFIYGVLGKNGGWANYLCIGPF